MNLEELTSFFMWCSIMNAGLLLFWTVICVLAQDFVYTLHSRWFPMERAQFTIVLYCFLGLFKILVLLFNVVPWLALLLLQK